MSPPRRPPPTKASPPRASGRPAATRRRPASTRARRDTRSEATRPTANVRPLRVALLAGIVVILSITLVPTIHSYLHQRSQISSLRQHIDQQHRQVTDLQRQRARWDNPQYVEQRARERLKFVFPGEKSYTVLDDRGKRRASTGEPGVAEVSRNVQHHEPWWSQIWTSVQIADSGAQRPAPPPAKQAAQRPAPKPRTALPPIRDHRNGSPGK